MSLLISNHFSKSVAEKYTVSSVKPPKQFPLSSLQVQAPQPANSEELQCIEQLKHLIINNEDTRNSGIEKDDQLILTFVRGKRCKSQLAFKTLQNYVQVREVKYSKFFQTLNPANFRTLLEKDHFAGILKHTDYEGRAVAVCVCSLFNPRMHKGEDIFQAITCLGLELLHTDNASRNGIVSVIDASEVGLHHAREFTMGRLYMLRQLFLNSVPIKYNGIHVINNGYIWNTILAVIKQVLPKKLKERIYSHGDNYESFHKFVPKEILPERYGGVLRDDEAYLELEQEIFNNTEYYKTLSMNWKTGGFRNVRRT